MFMTLLLSLRTQPCASVARNGEYRGMFSHKCPFISHNPAWVRTYKCPIAVCKLLCRVILRRSPAHAAHPTDFHRVQSSHAKDGIVLTQLARCSPMGCVSASRHPLCSPTSRVFVNNGRDITYVASRFDQAGPYDWYCYS